MRLYLAIDSYIKYLNLSRYSYRHYLNIEIRLNRLNDYFNGMDLEEINEKILQDFLALPEIVKLSRGTYNHYLSTIRQLFTYHYNLGNIKYNPASNLKYVRVERPLVEYLTVDEIKKLLKCHYPYSRGYRYFNLRDQLLFRLSIFCGLRTSEIRNLRWRDISFDQNQIFIRQGKNLKDRIVPITSKELLSVLRAGYYLKRGLPQYGHHEDNEFVVRGCKGVSVNAQVMNKTLRRCLTHCGIVKKNPHFHILRHTCATMYLRGKKNKRGMDLRLIQELLGHSTIMATQVYTHVDKSLLTEEMKRANPISYL